MIDTLKLSRRLEGAGMDRRQAEELADGLAESLGQSIEGRLDRMESRLDRMESRLDRMESRLDRVGAELADLRGDLKLLKWMVGVVVALVTGVLIKLLVG